MKIFKLAGVLTVAAAAMLGACGGVEDNKSIAMRVSEEVVVQVKSQELIADNFTYYPGSPPPGATQFNRKDTLAQWAGIAATFKDAKITWLHVNAEGEFVNLHYSLTATLVPSCIFGLAAVSGKTATWKGYVTRQIQNGQVVNEWDLVDLNGMLPQFGVTGAPCK